MEPLLVGETSKLRGELTDLAVELTAKSTALCKSLAPAIAQFPLRPRSLNELLLLKFD